MWGVTQVTCGPYALRIISGAKYCGVPQRSASLLYAFVASRSAGSYVSFGKIAERPKSPVARAARKSETRAELR